MFRSRAAQGLSQYTPNPASTWAKWSSSYSKEWGRDAGWVIAFEWEDLDGDVRQGGNAGEVSQTVEVRVLVAVRAHQDTLVNHEADRLPREGDFPPARGVFAVLAGVDAVARPGAGDGLGEEEVGQQDRGEVAQGRCGCFGAMRAPAVGGGARMCGSIAMIVPCAPQTWSAAAR